MEYLHEDLYTNTRPNTPTSEDGSSQKRLEDIIKERLLSQTQSQTSRLDSEAHDSTSATSTDKLEFVVPENSTDQRITVINDEIFKHLRAYLIMQSLINECQEINPLIEELKSVISDIKTLENIVAAKISVQSLFDKYKSETQYTPAETKLFNFLVGLMRGLFALPYLATRYVVYGNKENKELGDRPNALVRWATNGQRPNLFMYSDYKRDRQEFLDFVKSYNSQIKDMISKHQSDQHVNDSIGASLLYKS